MPPKNTKPFLSLSGIPKNALHNILHRLLMQQVQSGAYQKPTLGSSAESTSRQGATNKKQETSNIKKQARHRFILFQYYKNYRLLNRLKSKALALLKTQYAKKPKNPT